MANKEIHELITAEELSASDVIAEQRENGGTWLTRKLTFNALGLFLNKTLDYASDLHTTDKTIIGAINEVLQLGGNSNIADVYDNMATYNEGDYCIYNNILYKCLVDITVAEEWNSSHWVATLVTDELSSGGGGSLVQSDLTAVASLVWTTRAKKNVKNGICYIDILGGTNGFSENQTIFSGAPIPETGYAANLIGLCGGVFYRFYVDTQGNVKCRNPITASNAEFTVFGSYFTAN